MQNLNPILPSLKEQNFCQNHPADCTLNEQFSFYFDIHSNIEKLLIEEKGVCGFKSSGL